MKVATLNNGKGKSALINEFLRFTKCLTENVDERTGLTYYRGVIYSYDSDVHCCLLGSDMNGGFRVIDIVYDGNTISKKIKGVVNYPEICKAYESLLSIIDKIPTPLSKIYFDFNESSDVNFTNCFMFEDLDESGSSVMLIETDKAQVDTYMLRPCFPMCRGTLLCESFSNTYRELMDFAGTEEELVWFKERGVRVV